VASKVKTNVLVAVSRVKFTIWGTHGQDFANEFEANKWLFMARICMDSRFKEMESWLANPWNPGLENLVMVSIFLPRLAVFKICYNLHNFLSKFLQK
jgi:hypothetical protein